MFKSKEIVKKKKKRVERVERLSWNTLCLRYISEREVN